MPTWPTWGRRAAREDLLELSEGKRRPNGWSMRVQSRRFDRVARSCTPSDLGGVPSRRPSRGAGRTGCAHRWWLGAAQGIFAAGRTTLRYCTVPLRVWGGGEGTAELRRWGRPFRPVPSRPVPSGPVRRGSHCGQITECSYSNQTDIFFLGRLVCKVCTVDTVLYCTVQYTRPINTVQCTVSMCFQTGRY